MNSKRIPALIVSCLALLVPASAAQGAATWLPPAELASGEVSLGEASLTPQGETIAVWRVFSEGQYKIQASVRPAGGSFTPAADVTPFGSIAEDLDLATDASGDAILTWRQVIGGGIGLFYSFRPAGGSFSAAQEVTGAGKQVALPQTAMDAAGNAITVFRRAPGGDEHIAYVFRPAGGNYGAQQELTSYVADSPDIAFTKSGTAIAAWNTGTKIEIARRPAGGSFGVVQSLPIEAFSYQLRVSPNGQALLSWIRMDVTEWLLEASLAEPGGTFGTPTTLSKAGDYTESFSTAIDPTGLAFIAWEDGDEGPLLTALGRAGEGLKTVVPPAGVDGYPTATEFPGTGSPIQMLSSKGAPPYRLLATTRNPAGAFSSPTTLGPLDKSVYLETLHGDESDNAVALFASDNGGGKATLYAAGYDGEAPRFLSVSIPASAKTGQKANFSAQVQDVWSSAKVEWEFGDGRKASGDSVTHTYKASGGKLEVEVTATDPYGNSRTETRTIDVKDVTRVVVRGAKFKPSTFAASSKATAVAARKARRGSVLRYRLSEKARVKVVVERKVGGKLKGKRCVAASKSPLGKPCKRFVRAAVKPLRRSGKAGLNRIAFTGKIGGKTLAPGSYRAALIATDTGRLKSMPKYARFTIVEP